METGQHSLLWHGSLGRGKADYNIGVSFEDSGVSTDTPEEEKKA